MPQTSREGGDDINDMAKLLEERALVLDMAGPDICVRIFVPPMKIKKTQSY
jgi:hypothetical protein